MNINKQKKIQYKIPIKLIFPENFKIKISENNYLKEEPLGPILDGVMATPREISVRSAKETEFKAPRSSLDKIFGFK